MDCVVDILIDGVQKYGNRRALSQKIGFRTTHVTYKELYDKARSMAMLLKAHGVKHGDKVLILAPNSPWWVVSYWGTLLAGGVIVPFTTQSTSDLIDKILVQTESRIFITWSRLIYDHPTHVEKIQIEYLPELLEKYDPTAFVPEVYDEHDLIEIMYTSGTTGEPKGVMLTNHNIMSNLNAIYRAIKLEGEKERLLSVLPLSHIFEQTIGMVYPISLGCHIVYAHSPTAIVSLMQQYKITKMAAVPEFLLLVYNRLHFAIQNAGFGSIFDAALKLCDHIDKIWFSRIVFWPLLRKLGGKLDTIASAGAPLDPHLERDWLSLGIYILQGYGLTETSPCVTTNTFEDHRYYSVGKPLYNVQVRIASDGEIQVKGPSVFQGYYKNPEKTAEAFTEDGWFKTGDMGEFDADGFLFLKGRKKYMIKSSGGQNVFPEDIEVVLNNIDGVKDSCVLGIEGKGGGGEAIHAVLLLEDKVPYSPDEIIKLANQKLSSYQQILSYSIWPGVDFPRSAVRKVRKEEVRKYLQAQEQQISAQPITQATKLHKLLTSITGIGLTHIHDGSFLVRDLKLDSLMRVELVGRIELEFNKAIDESLLTTETTVADLQQIIDKASSTRAETFSTWPLSWWARLLRPLMQSLFFLFARCFVRLEVHGSAHLQDIHQPVIFMPNHISYWDGLLLAYALPAEIRSKISFAAAEDFLFGKWGWAVWALELGFNVFRLPRTEGGSIRTGLDNIGHMLDKGYHVVLFPEGHVSIDGSLQELKQGAGLLATTMHADIVPVFIDGMRNLLSGPYSFIPKKRGVVRVIFGEPFQVSMKKSIANATQEIHAEMTELQDLYK